MDRFLDVAMVVVFVAAAARLRLTSKTYTRLIWRRPQGAPPEPPAGGVVLVPVTKRAGLEAVLVSTAAIGLTLLIGATALAGDLPGWFWSIVMGLAWAVLVFTAAFDIGTYRALRRLDTLATITPTAVTHHRTGKVIPLAELAEVTVARSIIGAESIRFSSLSATAIRVNLRHSAILYADGPAKTELLPIITALPRDGRVVE